MNITSSFDTISQLYQHYLLMPLALFIIVITIYLLIKRYETRMVLIGAGLFLCLFSLEPFAAFNKFSSSMVSAGLIQAICSSMGFAIVMSYTKCDKALIDLLTKPLSKLGFFLIPVTVILTAFINTAIPSAAGCAAAVGATMIPLLIASRIHPAIAASAVLCGTFGSFFNPGQMHNVVVAKMLPDINEIQLIIKFAPYLIGTILIGAVLLSIVALVRKEFNIEIQHDTDVAHEKSTITASTYLYASAPFIPLILLLGSNLHWFGNIKFDVPSAMLIGVLYGLIITLSNPGELTKEFFKGMGGAYGDIIGIIIAAGVFAQGLQSVGLIDAFITFLKENQSIARWGGTLGPFFMGVITGSGDAAALAFNEAVTPHAEHIGFNIENLGPAAAISGGLGRTMSPVAGVVIVCAGIAKVNPFELSKRVAPGMITAVLFIALFML